MKPDEKRSEEKKSFTTGGANPPVLGEQSTAVCQSAVSRTASPGGAGIIQARKSGTKGLGLVTTVR